MREIKFRAWMKPDKVMLSHEELMGIPVTYHDVFEGNSKYPCMQYTGLKDKNGVEIYEGDILQHCAWYAAEKPRNRLEVKWESGGFIAIVKDETYARELYELNGEVEVIGNIYEHKHLLEQQ